MHSHELESHPGHCGHAGHITQSVAGQLDHGCHDCQSFESCPSCCQAHPVAEDAVVDGCDARSNIVDDDVHLNQVSVHEVDCCHAVGVISNSTESTIGRAESLVIDSCVGSSDIKQQDCKQHKHQTESTSDESPSEDSAASAMFREKLDLLDLGNLTEDQKKCVRAML